MKNLLLIIGLAVASLPAHAYIGPGMVRVSGHQGRLKL
jgi:hypothetical protein